LRRRSALNFAKRASAPIPCATMMLAEPHALDTENRGNRLAPRLRPAMRLAQRLTAAVRALGARISCAYVEDRMLRAAMEFDLYRGRYKHTNKNDDDLPIVSS
jgi:phage tail tape-measure protein